MNSENREKRSQKSEIEIPVNPLPASNLGDVNQMEPTETSEQATWQPYKASTAHMEPQGHLDERGIKEQDDTVMPRKRHGDKFPVANKTKHSRH